MARCVTVLSIAVGAFGASACSLLMDLSDFSGASTAEDAGDDDVAGDAGADDAPSDPLDSSADSADATPTGCTGDGACTNGICALGSCRLPDSCRELHAAHPELPSGPYMIDRGADGGIAPYAAYCDMTTDPGGWTLVFVGRGKQWVERFTTSFFAADIVRDDMTKGVHINAEYLVMKDWPAYTHLFYERWLPSSLTGRIYAAPGWQARTPIAVSATRTTMNFWSADRQNVEGWGFDLECMASAADPSTNWPCDELPLGKRVRHIQQCNGCKAAYLWFQKPECAWTQNPTTGYWSGCGAWNAFFPDASFGYWRITNEADREMQWPEYDLLQEGQAMPGYGLYVY